MSPKGPKFLTYDTDLRPDTVADEGAKFFRADNGTSRVNPKTSKVYDIPPWIDPPPGYEPFMNNGTINCPAQDATDHTIFSFTVPPEWDGIVTMIANAWNGTPFTPFSGSAVWRVLHDGIPFKGYDNIQWSYGTVSSSGILPMDLSAHGIIVRSGQVISMVFQNVTLTAGATQVFGLLGGYFWPLQ